MTPKLLTKAELAKIAQVTGDKLRLNARVYRDQLLGHIAALEEGKSENKEGDKGQ